MTKNYNEIIIELLTESQLTLSTCESITGGMIASNLVMVPNASKVFKGGIIAYTNEIKQNIVGVDAKTLSTYGAISPQTAKEMAIGMIKKFKTDLSLAITGNAGPSLSEGKPEGLVYLCIVVVDKAYNYSFNFLEKERNANRIAASAKALEELAKLLVQLKR